MKKKLSLLMVALVAIAAFAVQQTRRAAAALIDYPTSKTGITLVEVDGEGVSAGQVSYASISIKGTATDCIKFGKSIKNAENEKYYVELSVEGGFKKGDVISVTGAYTNAASKNAAIVFYDENWTGVWTTENFVNVNDGETEPAAQQFTLTADAAKLYFGRSGNTGTCITSLTITREAEEQGGGDPVDQPTDEGWVKTAPADLVTGDVVVIVDQAKSVALPNNNGTSSPSQVTVTLNDDKSQIAGDVASTIQWVVTKDGDNYQFNIANTPNYLYVTASNSGVRVGSGERNTFTVKTGGDNNGYYLFNTAKKSDNTDDDRYIGAYSTSDWRCYTSINNNIKGNNNAFYKKTQVPVTVARPTFSVEPGAYTSAQSVELSALPADAKIYYTVDGTDPTAESTEYTAAIAVDATTTIKAIAIKGEDKSKIATAEYTILESIANTEATAITVADAIALISSKDAAVLAHADNKVFVKGVVSKVGSFNETYKSLTYWISDDGTEENAIQVYAGKGIAGADFASADDVKVGAAVVVKGNLKKFNTTNEIDSNNELVKYVGPVGNVTVEATDITDGDITKAINAKAVGISIGNITINLAENGAYTVSASIEAGGNVVINGNGSTIDASALTAPFIALATEPVATFLPKNDGSGDTDYYGIDKVDINNVKVTGLKNSIFWDSNKKYCVVDFKIDNCVFALATEAVQNEALISFQAGGAKDFAVKNSTISGNNAVAKYFIRYNNSSRIDRYGFVQSDDTWSFTYENNTFYGLLKSDGQWGNYNGVSQKPGQLVLTVKNNIWYNCDAQTMRRLNQSKNFSNFNSASAMANNTFWYNGAAADQGSYGNGSDLTTDPAFKDAANADFTVNAGSQQAKLQTGDVTHWPVTYDPTLDPAVLWYSATPVAASWGSADIKVDAEKLANVKVGDILHVAVEIATPGGLWDAQVVLKDGSFADLEGGVPCGDGSVTDATFVVTGDILARIQATGLLASGAGYSTTMVSLEAGTATGSDASIWVGNSNTYVSVNAKHFLNANGGHYETIDEQLTWVGGVEAGDIIRVTCTEAAGVEEADRYIIAQYSGNDTGWQWTDYENFPAVKTATGFVFVVPESNVAELKTDGIIINQKGYNITQVELVKSQVVDVELALETGAVINEALAAKTTEITAAGDKVGNITINLAENGAYTVSAPIEGGASIAINGAAGAKIDASGNTTGAFVKMAATPAVTPIKANNQDTYCISGISLKNVVINDLKGSLFYDSNVKYRVDDFTIDNVVVRLDESAVDWESIIAFQAGGSKAFAIKNSTIYGNANNKSKYFFRYASNGRLDRLGYDKNTEIQSWTYENNTFYNVLKSDGQWGNGQNGQSFMAYYVKNNIWYNCGDKGQSIIARLGFGRIATEHKEFVNNTYFADSKDNSVKEASYEPNALTTDPYFKDAANGDFAIASNSAQAKAEGGQTGDARWGTYDAGFAVKAVNAEGITITPEVAYAAEGVKVYATFTLAEGYDLEQPDFVDDNGDAIEFAEGQIGIEKVGDVEKMFIIMPAKNVTIIAKASKKYQIALNLSQENGTATCLSVNAEDPSTSYKKEGKEIYLAITPASGYEAEISVMAGETPVEVIAEAGTYSEQAYTHKFIMPASDVTVTVTFKSTVGINSIAADKMKNATIYNMKGQRVDKAQKGLYIINGKKVVIK